MTNHPHAFIHGGGRIHAPRPKPPVEEPPNAPQPSPVEEPGKPSPAPPPPQHPPVKEPPGKPQPPVREPPPDDPGRRPPHPPPEKRVSASPWKTRRTGPGITSDRKENCHAASRTQSRRA